MKKLILLICISLLSSAGFAQNIKAIRVTSSNGESAVFQMSNALTMIFEEDELVTTDGVQTISFGLDDLKIEYLSDVSGIELPFSKQMFVMKDNMLIAQGVERNKSVQVFHPSGMLLRTESPKDADGIVCIPLSSFPKGVFIVKFGKISLKYQHQ